MICIATSSYFICSSIPLSKLKLIRFSACKLQVTFVNKAFHKYKTWRRFLVIKGFILVLNAAISLWIDYIFWQCLPTFHHFKLENLWVWSWKLYFSMLCYKFKPKSYTIDKLNMPALLLLQWISRMYLYSRYSKEQQLIVHCRMKITVSVFYWFWLACLTVLQTHKGCGHDFFWSLAFKLHFW